MHCTGYPTASTRNGTVHSPTSGSDALFQNDFGKDLFVAVFSIMI